MKKFVCVLALVASSPVSAQVYVDTVNSFTGGSGNGVYDSSVTYTGPSGPGSFDPAAVTSLDGSGWALGSFGEIVVSFSGFSVIDGAGNDFSIFDTLGLSEGLTVEASQNGSTFALVGSFPGNFSQSCSFAAPCATSLDLAASGLSSASFFRLTALQGACVSGYPECYDFDTLGALNFAPQGAVPEPATWAMMLLGFGAIGFVIRRRKAALPQVA